MTNFPTIGLEVLSVVTGGAGGAVTADTFMPRAYALQSMNDQNEKAPSAKLSGAIHKEFCGALYPYAQSGAPINSAFGGIARSRVVAEGNKICK
jgi:hypothetical protein